MLEYVVKVEELPLLVRPFYTCLEVVLTEEASVKSCLSIEEIPEENPTETQTTPDRFKVPHGTSTPKSKSRSKGSAMKNSLILDYFKLRNNNEELGGDVGTLKRKRTNEMEENEQVNPAKKVLVMESSASDLSITKV